MKQNPPKPSTYGTGTESPEMQSFQKTVPGPGKRTSPSGGLSMRFNLVKGALVALALVLIFVGSLALAKRHVAPDPSGMELTVDVPMEEVRISPLKKLWKEHGIKASFEMLKNPLVRKTLLSEPLTLNAANPSWEMTPLRLELHFREKTHTMGHRDTHAVLLHISGKSSKPLAFRVDSSEGRLFVECKNIRAGTAHQFILPAGGSVERLEGCTGTPSSAELVIRRIQILELNESAVISLGRVIQPVGLSFRLRSQHKSLEINPLPSCIIPDFEVMQNRILENPDIWFDIMDFLARHDCARERMP